MNLAARMRPKTIDEYIGQGHLVGKEGIIRQFIENKSLPSLILWGPPGVGKTTLAYILAKAVGAQVYELSGVKSGKDDLMQVVQQAQNSLYPTVLFIDEIHRWNKAQQDALLPYVEQGTFTLIGATTENPSFEIIGALLSRCRVFTLEQLTEDNLKQLIVRAVTDEREGLGAYHKTVEPNAQDLLVHYSGGDARTLLNALELAVTGFVGNTVTTKEIEQVFQGKAAALYDKNGEEHYNTISAFIKSMRGSNEQAALYYMYRMLQDGEDPIFIARRMVIFASEDIGLADRYALILANEAFAAVERVGLPEGYYPLTHACVYLSRAAKSREIANTIMEYKQLAEQFPREPVPLHLRNAPTKLMKSMGYGKGYHWEGERPELEEGKSYLPEKVEKAIKGKK